MVKNFFKASVLRHPPEDIGEALISWTFSEYEKHERGRVWMIVAGIVFAMLLIYSIYTMNFLFAVIVLLFAFIGVFQHYQHPDQVEVVIAEDGVLIGTRFFHYHEFASFWMIYEPPIVKSLYFDFKASGKRSISVPLHEMNPLVVREILEQYLDENFEEEFEFFDQTISRVMKL